MKQNENKKFKRRNTPKFQLKLGKLYLEPNHDFY